MRMLQVKWVLALTMAIPAMAFATQNCGLTRPPREAAVNVNHGQFYFIHPRLISIHYTGCQTMWDEKANKIWVVHYANGKPAKLAIMQSGQPPKRIECIYRDGALSEGPEDQCVEFASLSKGIPSIAAKDAPAVPKNRDARR
jgi:hypothetical protein